MHHKLEKNLLKNWQRVKGRKRMEMKTISFKALGYNTDIGTSNSMMLSLE